jgi:hypothetical protein
VALGKYLLSLLRFAGRKYGWKPRHHKKAALAPLNYMALATHLLLHAPMQEKMSPRWHSPPSTKQQPQFDDTF